MKPSVRPDAVADRRNLGTPNDPWLRREDWSAGQIPCRASAPLAAAAPWAVVAFSWLFALGLSALSLAAIVRVLPELILPDQILVPIFLLVLFGGGCFLLRDAVHATRQWKYGWGSVFVMSAVPGVLGGRLEGVIRVHPKLRNAGEIDLVLACMSDSRPNTSAVMTRAAPGKKFIARSALWHERQRTSELIEDGDGIAIRVSFQIPFDLPESDCIVDRRLVFWRLETRPPLAGVVLFFEVPVFKTAESDATIVLPARKEVRAPLSYPSS